MYYRLTAANCWRYAIKVAIYYLAMHKPKILFAILNYRVVRVHQESINALYSNPKIIKFYLFVCLFVIPSVLDRIANVKFFVTMTLTK